jgi:hypothetical protein
MPSVARSSRVFPSLASFFVLAVLLSCSGSSTSSASPVVFKPEVTKVVIEVDYAVGAEPYTGDAGRLGDVWSLYRSSLDGLFEGKKELVIPSQLSEMEPLTDVTATELSSDDILAIAKKHRNQKEAPGTATYYIVFTNATFRAADGTKKPDVLGVSVGDSRVIAMFKPVIRTTEGQRLVVAKFVEQSVLVHEFGHAAGLVNRGLALTSPHHDAANGAHCTNTSCVMYWENEGTKSATAFAQQYLATGNTVLYGRECLDDAKGATSK